MANKLAHLRGTAAVLLCVEPTRPDPHARWCGEGARQRASLPDLPQIWRAIQSLDCQIDLVPIAFVVWVFPD
jgi:hypothetical protein